MPIDYLLLGLVTRDILSDGERLGGSVAYAAWTARALGRFPAIVTACEPTFSLDSLKEIPVERLPSNETTTFENLQTERGRVQYVRAVASPLDFDSVPVSWRDAEILHLAPIAREIPPALPDSFSPSFLGITPQGWMRRWDESGRVFPARWEGADSLLRRADAVVLSLEDVDGDEARVRDMARLAKTLVLTEGRAGARVFWKGEEKHIASPSVPEFDSTGAGDIFAASFFIRYYTSGNAWSAAHFAACVAAQSVTRSGIESVPSRDEIQLCQTEDG